MFAESANGAPTPHGPSQDARADEAASDRWAFNMAVPIIVIGSLGLWILLWYAGRGAILLAS